MRTLHPFTILSFATTAAAMQTEQFCRERGIPGRLIPLPEEIAAGCGLAWRMEVEDWEAHRESIEAAALPVAQSQIVQQWVFASGSADADIRKSSIAGCGTGESDIAEHDAEESGTSKNGIQ